MEGRRHTNDAPRSDFILYFSISISCILDASPAQDVRVAVWARAKEERTMNTVAALLKCIYLLGSEGVVAF
jgi:hypothetical protein